MANSADSGRTLRSGENISDLASAPSRGKIDVTVAEMNALKEPGVPDKPKSFFNSTRSDNAVAAYLSITNLDTFRQLRLSTPVLHWTHVLRQLKDMRYSNSTSKANDFSNSLIIQAIRDVLDQREKAFPAEPSVLVTTFLEPLENKELSGKERKHLLGRFQAACVFNCHMELLAMTPANYNADRHYAALRRFIGGLEGHDPIDLKFQPIEVPLLGPWEDYNECPLESFNRVSALMRNLNDHLRIWKTTIGKQGATKPKSAVPHDVVPMWMRPKSSPTVDAVSQQDILAFTLKFDYEADTIHQKGLVLWKRERDRQGCSIPDLIQTVRLPRAAYTSFANLRDGIRTLLSFPALGLGIFSLTAKIDGKVYDFSQNVQPRLGWEELLSLVAEHDIHSVFNVKPQPLDDDDDDDMECPELPTNVLRSLLRIRDNELQPLDPKPTVEHHDDGTDGQVGEGASQTKTAEQQKRNQNLKSINTIRLSEQKTRLPFEVPEAKTATAKARLKDAYEGYDVSTPEGLIRWQRWMLSSLAISGTHKMEKFRLPDRDKRLNGRVSELKKFMEKSAIESIPDAEILAEAEAQIDNEDLQADQNVVAKAIQGVGSTGPRCDKCREALSMMKVGLHNKKAEYPLWKSKLLPKSTATLLDSQVNGAVHLLRSCHGRVPLGRDELGEMKWFDGLESQRTYGGLLVDNTGFGKTHTALLALTWHALYSDHVDPVTDKVSYRPSLIVVPGGSVLAQWKRLLEESFQDLQVIIAYGPFQTFAHSRMADKWVSARAFREAPDELSQWPAPLRYVFDQTNPMAARTVILTTYETFSDRTVEKRQSLVRDKNDNPIVEDGKPLVRTEFLSRWKDRIELVVLDEAHRLRHHDTKTFASIAKLQAPYHFILTATPIVNSPSDYVAYTRLLWPQIKRHLEVSTTETVIEILAREKLPWGCSIFEELSALPELDERRLLFLEPHRVDDLINLDDTAAMRKWFPFVDNTIAIRRSTASELDLDGKNKLSLKDLMPDYVIRTVELNLRDTKTNERRVYQSLHNTHASRYMSILRAWAIQNQGRPADESNFPPVTQHLRAMTVNATATSLGRFDLKKVQDGFDTFSETIHRARGEELTVDQFISYIIDPTTEIIPQTHHEKLAWLVDGSPKLGYLLHVLLQTVLAPTRPDEDPYQKNQKKRKLIITEEVPLSAAFWEMILNWLHIPAVWLHAGLTDTERADLIRDFNSSTMEPAVLILQYNVGAQGVNLDRQCSNVLVMTPATNAASEIQAWGRVIRVSQTEKVIIWRARVSNTHDEFREARQIDKQLLDLASRSLNPEVTEILLLLLNSNNDEVEAAHKSPFGRRLLELGLPNPIEYIFVHGCAPGDMPTPSSTAAPMHIDITTATPEQRKAAAEAREKIRDMETVEDNNDMDTDFEPDIEPDDRHLQISNKAEQLANRKAFSKLDIEQQNSFDQQTLYQFDLLRLNPKHVYTEEDFVNGDFVLRRSLRLLYQSRLGAHSKSPLRINPHIKYDALPKALATTANQNAAAQESDVLTNIAKKAYIGAGHPDSAKKLEESMSHEPGNAFTSQGKKRAPEPDGTDSKSARASKRPSLDTE